LSRNTPKKIFLNIIFLSILTTVVIFSGSVLLAAEAISEFYSKAVTKIDYIDESTAGGKAIEKPMIFTIQGAIPPTGTVAETIQPKVTTFNPANGATGIPLLSTITATFSEPVQPSTISTSTFQVKDSGGATVPGTVTMEPAGVPPKVIVFKPSSQLASSKTYSVTITTGVKDLAGNPLASVAKSFFTTGTQASGGTSPSPTGTSGDTTQLKVVSIKPVDRATGVPITSTIVVTFSKAVLPSSVTTTFDLITAGPGGGVGPLQIPSIVHVPGTATLSTDGKTVTFRPNAPFEVTKTYTYSILGPKDLAGSPLTPNPNISGSFTTGSP
jgi:hypothetical protein